MKPGKNKSEKLADALDLISMRIREDMRDFPRDPSYYEDNIAKANTFLMDWVCEGWGPLPPEIEAISLLDRPLTFAEKVILVHWFDISAPGDY